MLMAMFMVLFGGFRAAGQAMPDEVCLGATKHYWVDPNPIPGSTYTWQINGVTQISTTNEIWVTWDAPIYTVAGSPYTITVQERSVAGCYGDVRTGLVTILPVLPVSVSVVAGQNPACSGIPVTFTATAINGGVSPVYNWTVNGNPVGANSNTYAYLPVSGDVVTCEVNSSAKCVTNNPATSAPVTMQVGTSPDVTFVPCFNIITSAEAQPFKLRGGLPLGGTYSGGTWVNNPSAGMFNPQAAPTGSVAVTYSYTNNAGCTGSAVGYIQNNPAPASFTCGTDDWTDIRDGKTYHTIQINTQCWMAENLNYGTQIVSTQVQAANCVMEKYCYNNDPVNCNGSAGSQPAFGGLYQWDELMMYDNTPASQGICPPGWHVPSESEWTVLLNFYGGNSLAGKPLQDLVNPGFHALPGGVLYMNNTWSFKGLATLFWTSTPTDPVKIISHGMNNIDPSVSYYESVKANAFPVRCLKDN